jgi:two-component system C4-dicarboxylate transport sensor histidine kinase DctB
MVTNKSIGKYAVYFLVVGALVAFTSLAYIVAERIGIASLRAAMASRQDMYVASLESEMRRYEYLPQVIGSDPRVLGLLSSSGDVTQQQVNVHLETISSLVGASAIYVMNMAGLTVASSNWDTPMSFVNAQFAYRPYFQDAVRGLSGRFYGVGTVSREPGYYFANAIKKDGTTIGVAAVKVNLDKLDETWARSTEHIVVVDGNGVVFLASDPRWKFKALHPLSSETMGRLAATRQYWKPGSLEALGLIDRQVLDDRTAILGVTAESSAGLTLRETQYMVHGSDVHGTDWQLLVMADMAPVHSMARLSAVSAALTLILTGTLFLYAKQRFRFVAQRLSTQAALQRANDELEEKVQARTEALRQANCRLQNEIGERRRAEATLKSTLHDLVHTAKMAVLGKMSASITHELNQPLAALLTLSDNTSELLERSMYKEAKRNLRMIAITAAKMGRITGQLKKFARRSDIDSEPVLVNEVLRDALFLMKQSIRGREIRLVQCVPEVEIWARCDANRLEQVFVNLVSNAADAVEHLDAGVVEVALHSDAENAYVEVHDNGGGIDDEVAPHLFEPFYSTKEHGAGLGLGLAISNDIVRHFGGTLQADRSARLGGAVFTVQLKISTSHLMSDIPQPDAK